MQQQDGGRVTSVVVVVVPVATSNSSLSLASLHYGTGIHQHRWPVVVHISPLMTLRFFTISLMNLCCRSFCFFLFGPHSQRQSSSSCAMICCSRWLQARGSQLHEKLQNGTNSEACEIQCQSSRAQHPHCLTYGSRLQQRVSSSSSWLGRSAMPSSSLRGFNSTRIYLSKRPIFVSFFCRFTDSTQEHYLLSTYHCLSFQMEFRQLQQLYIQNTFSLQ